MEDTVQFEMINTTAAGWTPWGHGSINQLVATNRVRACTRTPKARRLAPSRTHSPRFGPRY